MIVGFTCPSCRLDNVACDVPDRGAEDVTVWLEQTVRIVALDHRRLSPGCLAQTVDLVIPFGGTQRVGAPMLH